MQVTIGKPHGEQGGILGKTALGRRSRRRERLAPRPRRDLPPRHVGTCFRALPRINAAHGVLYDTAYMLGPVLGTLAAREGHPALIPLLAAPVLALFAVYGGRVGEGEGRGPRPGLRDLLGALPLILASPILRRSVTLGMAWNLTCLGPLEVLLPLLAREAGGDALDYGLLKGASPAGFILGILLAGALLPAGLASRRLLLYALALLLQGLILGLMGRTTTPLLLLVLAFLGGLATGPTDVYVKLIRQREVPVGLQGRYLGLTTALAYLASALGLALLGAVLGRVGPRQAAALAGGSLAVAALWAIFSGAAEADGRPPDPGRRTARKRFLGG